jgi:hypothetical protein
MKAYRFVIFFTICLALLLQQSWSLHKPKTPYNGITVNGQPLQFNTFYLYSSGVLALSQGQPQSSERTPVSFRVTLRRGRDVVRQWPSNDGAPLYSLQLDDVWPHAGIGDELVIESVGATGTTPKRIIKLSMFNWIRLPGKGC